MKFKNYVAVGMIALLGIFSSCGEKVYEGDTIIVEGGNANIETIDVTVYAEDWKWNEKTGRYEVTVDVDKMTEKVVDDAAIIAYIMDGKVNRNLPYSEEYRDNDGNVYTERIAYEVFDHLMSFFKEENDMGQGLSPKKYVFKVVIIQEKTKR